MRVITSKSSHRFPSVWVALLVAALCAAFSARTYAAKNVIILIADGSGFNSWRAASMYQGKLGKEVYDGKGWVRMAACTYPLSQSSKPRGTGKQNPDYVYDPAKAWSSEPPTVKPGAKPGSPFAGYEWLKRTYTDSAAAATAMGSGMKTYNNAINWTDFDKPLTGKSLAEVAKAAGKSVGVITSVPWSHATPAGLGGAHNVSRNNYSEIANEMLGAPYLDVIMGAGHPDFTEDNVPRKPAESGAKVTDRDYQYVGGPATWEQLKAGTHPGGWKLIETLTEFQSLAKGPTPSKVLGTAQVATTLQQKRGKPTEKQPLDCPFNRNLPALAAMTRAAINCLDDNPKGFYLMIEGGAVDWANHENHAPRMVEEQIFFMRAVEAVVRWVEANSSWDETLVVLTADHETGLIWGPGSDKAAFQPMIDSGPKKVPGLKYNHTSHSNSLVPLYARGPGAARFDSLIAGTDKQAAAVWGISGKYVNNTSIYTVASGECTQAAEETPPAADPK